MSEVSPLGSQLNQRYRTEKLLIDHSCAQTWIAVDLDSQKRVILKTAALNSISAKQIEREAELLRSIRNRFLPRLVEHGVIGNRAFLVREFCGGKTLSEVLRAGPMPLMPTLKLASELLTFLKEIHESGIIHRDLKPENVILDGEKASIIDFGLSKLSTGGVEPQYTLVGSVRYMAPEQAGTLKFSVGSNADLFSLGCIVYECLKGTPLFSGKTVHEVLRQQIQNGDHARPADSIAHVPAAVRQWLNLLLQKDPRQRYQSADLVLDDVREIIWRLNSKEAEFELSKQRHKLALSDPAFIGRKKELRQLQNETELARQGFGQLVLLEAESGGGKSRLLQEFVPDQAWVLRGQGVDQSATRPFQIFNNVIESVIARAQCDSSVQRRLKETLAPYAQSIVDAFPNLRNILDLQSLQIVGPEELAEQRVLHAVTELLNCIGMIGKPAVIMLDDVQWADELSVKLLSYWVSYNKDRKSHCMIIASFRTEDVAADHPLRGIRKVRHIRLPAFSIDDIAQLVNSMAGRFPTEVLDLITGLSQGNVFMACSVIHGLYEAKAILPTAHGWQVDPTALSQAQSSRKAAVFLARRLQKFPAETLHILRIASVLGKEFNFELLQQLSGVPDKILLDHLLEAHVRKVIWMRPNEKRFMFAHDKIRETLLEGLSEEKCADLHLAAAGAIEAADQSKCFDLAYHYAAARHYIKAFPYAMAAARQARAQHSLRLAETYFEIALKAHKEFSPGEQLEALESSGDVYMLLGKYDLARKQYEAVRELNTNAFFRSQLDGKMGELLFKQGNIEEAAAKVEQALRHLSHWVPRTRWGFLIGALWETLIQVGHSLLGTFGKRKPNTEQILTIHLYSRLAYINWFGKGAVPCLWAHLREMNMAERFEETLALAQAYSEHAPVMTQLPWFKRGHDYGLRSLEIRRRFGDVWGEAQSLHFLGVVLYSSTQYKSSLQRCREAMELFERTGDRWEYNTASWHTAYAHYRLGNLKEALEVARRTYESGRVIGDHHATGISLSAWSKITQGRVPEELIREELKRMVGDAHTRIEILTAEAIRLLRVKEFDQSIARLTEAVRILRQKGLRQEYVVPAQIWLVTALREKMESLPFYAVRERKLLALQAKVQIRRALRLARFYRNNWPHTLREAGWLLSCQGKTNASVAMLKKSISSAQLQGARYEEGQSWKALGEILSNPDLRAQGERMMIQCERPMVALIEGQAVTSSVSSPSLADRFSSLLEVGRKIVGALDRQSVFDEAQASAQQLLRAPHCSVVELENHHLPASENLSQQLFEACMTRGRSACMEEFLNQNATDSLLLMEATSALYAPIYVDGQAVALLVATHHGVTSLFGEEEKRLADYISTLTGAALKNAERVARIQKLSDERNDLFKEAQKAIETRDQFLSLASHELKTPLTALHLQSHLFSRSKNSIEACTQFIPSLNRQILRLNRLVDDLLDVSKLNSGKFELGQEREVFLLNELVSEILSELQVEMDQSSCTIVCSCPLDVKVVAGRDRLSQVITNLLVNAKKYAPGLIKIEIQEDAHRIALSVQDHGPGIDPDYQRAVFERFERAPQKSPVGGLGLGLYISREIIRAHGGELSLESSPAGSTFSFYLPK